MEKNDIAPFYTNTIACWFEGLLMTPRFEPEKEKKRKLFSFRKEEEDQPLTEERYIQAAVRSWQPNELPLKSVIHLTNQLSIGVDVYTYLDPIFHEAIEGWLARKGAHVNVYHYDDVDHLWSDLKYNRDVHTLFTPYEEDARKIGWHRVTVVNPDGTFGF